MIWTACVSLDETRGRGSGGGRDGSAGEASKDVVVQNGVGTAKWVDGCGQPGVEVGD